MSEINAKDWERVQELFERALEEPPEKRDAFLREASSGAPELAQEVTALIAAYERDQDPATIPGTWLRALGTHQPHRFTHGDIVAGRYEIRQLLGIGGMGEVYEAWDRGLSITVALKALRIVADTEASRRRLEMEGFLARSVWHPAICRVYDLGRHVDEGRTLWFLTMERLDGETLAKRLGDAERLPSREARPLAVEMAAGLGAAHAAGVVHRDFKPGNVMLVKRGGAEQAVVTDFGIGRWNAEDEPTQASQVLGTPAYMSPEQLRGEPGGPAADIYALGVVLFEMVTGQLPFPGGTGLEDAKRRLTEEPRSPLALAPDLDERWAAAIARCLAREPERRFRHAEAVAAALAGQIETAEIGGAATRAARAVLPAERDDFIGRAVEIESLERSLDEGVRLVTLVGTGGMGKTRLATHYGWRALERWPGGVAFCDLREAPDVSAIASVVARSLGVPLGRLDPIQQLGDVIAGRGRCLLILDNFDRLVEQARATVAVWLERAPEASFLVTSRERLHLDPTERVLPIEPLEPEMATVLFAARAHRLVPGLDLEGPARQDVLEIVRLVDGMPLAIELAASRVRVMPVSQIVDTMRDRFRLLTGGATTRHETLEVAIDGSWELLTPWEQSAFAQCSAFESGFTLEAAEHVLDLGPWPEAPSIVEVLRSLTDRSLLRVETVLGGQSLEARFGMYVSLKDYAHQKRGAEDVEARHGRWYAHYGTDEAMDGLDERGGVDRRRRLELELSNVIAACRRALGRGNTAVAAASYRAAVEVFAMRGPFQTGIEMGQAVLENVALGDPERARVLLSLARVERLAGTKESARAHSEEALALAEKLEDRRLRAHLVDWLGNLDFDEGAAGPARARYEEARSMYEAEGDQGRVGLVLSHLGLLEQVHARYEPAIAHYRAALARLREGGDLRREAYVHGYLGSLYRYQGRFEEALAEQTEALRINREVGDRINEAMTVGNMGNLYVEMGRIEEARASYEAAVAMTREMGDRRNEGLFLSNLGNQHLQQGRLQEARVCVETALRNHRQVGTKFYEGFALRLLGRLSHLEGRIDSARDELAQAEAILREVQHENGAELAKVLCHRGELDLETNKLESALAALSEVENLARDRGWRSEGELGATIAHFREALSAKVKA